MQDETWVIKMTRQGLLRPYQAYYATPRFQRHKGSAKRYESASAAQYDAYALKEAGRCIDFEIERIPADPPRRSGVEGTGGSA